MRRPPVGRNEQLDALYAQLPNIECQGRCHTACGPIDMSSAERTRIGATGLHIPAGSFTDGPRDCPALTMFKRCSVYQIRPLICRIWGLTPQLACHYGCKPERYLTEPEAYELIAQAFDISGQHERAEMTRLGTKPEHQQRMTEIWDALQLRTELALRRRGRGRAR